MPKPIPQGFHTVTPHLVVRGCAEALKFYEKAFGAEILEQSAGPGGLVMHSVMQIGDSRVMVVDEFPHMESASIKAPAGLGGTSVTLHVFTPDVDAAHRRAVEAGATESMPPADMFWGDRFSMVTDPYGHAWSLATHIEDLTVEERQQRAQKAMGGGGGGEGRE